MNAPSRFRREQNHVADPRARARKKCSLTVRHESNLTKKMLSHGSARANTTSPAPTRRRARRIFSPSRLRREGKSQQNLTSPSRFGSALWRSAPDIFDGDGLTARAARKKLAKKHPEGRKSGRKGPPGERRSAQVYGGVHIRVCVAVADRSIRMVFPNRITARAVCRRLGVRI